MKKRNEYGPTFGNDWSGIAQFGVFCTAIAVFYVLFRYWSEVVRWLP